MERQGHCPLAPKSDWCVPWSFQSSCTQNMDPYSRVEEEDTSYRKEMLPKTSSHLLQRSCYEWRSEEHYQAFYWAVWRSYQHCEKIQIEMVWAHNKINRTCKDNLTGRGPRRENKRQTEKEMGRQYIRMDRITVGWSPLKGWGQRAMEKSSCPVILDAPTVIQTTG